MQSKLKPEIFLILLFLLVLAFRLFFAFRFGHFNTDDAYFHLRQIEHFVENGHLLYFDELSYGGRFIFYPPLFHLVMGAISFGSIFMLKLIPELLFALTVFIIYAIARDISGSKYCALFAAAISAFIPMLFIETLNSISVYSFVIPLLLLMLYSLVRLENKKWLWVFIVCSFILSLTHHSALIFVVTILLYFFLIAGGALKATKIKKEAAIFSILLIILLQFIIYKKLFLEFGAGILKQNIPLNILADSFRQLTPLDLLVGIGLLPLVLGAFGVYSALIKEKKKLAYIFGAFALAVLLLLVLRLITISVGLMFLGISLSIFAAPGIKVIYDYFSNFKFHLFKHAFVVLLVFLFIILSLSPSFLVADKSAAIDEVEIEEIKWLIHNTNEDDVILANVGEGNLIAAVADRKTVADNNFLFAPDPIERVNDIKSVYSTVSEAIALKLIHKYDVDVIYLSDDTRREYGILELSYTEKVFDRESLIGRSDCFDVEGRGTYYVVQC